MSVFYQNAIYCLSADAKYCSKSADEMLVLRKMEKTDPWWALANSFNYACNDYSVSNYYMFCTMEMRW